MYNLKQRSVYEAHHVGLPAILFSQTGIVIMTARDLRQELAGSICGLKIWSLFAFTV